MKIILSCLSLISLVCLLSCGKATPPVDEQVDVEVCDPASPAGCSWSLQSELDLAHYHDALEVIDAHIDKEAADLSPSDPAFQAMMSTIMSELEKLEGVKDVSVDGRWIQFTVLPGHYAHDVAIGLDLPLSSEVGKQLASAPEDLEGRITRLFGSVEVKRQALVTQTATPLPRQMKRARFFAPWNWYFEEFTMAKGEFAHFRKELAKRRDYQAPGSIEVITRESPWVPDEEHLDEGLLPFTGWSELDLINVVTHGKNAPLRLSTGIVIGSERGGDKANLVGITCEELWRSRVPRGIRCNKRLEIAVEGEEEDFTLYVILVDQRFLENHGSKLADTRSILILEACSTLKSIAQDALLQQFIGQETVIYGGDEYVEATSVATFRYQIALLTFGLPTHIAYALLEEEDHTSHFGGGIYRLYPETKGLRAAEVISLHAPGEEGHLKDGSTLPVELDDEGRPRLLKVDARYFGVLTQDIDKTLFGAPQRYEIQDDPSLWVTRVEEMSGTGEDATSKGNLLGEPRTLFTNPRPVDTGLTEFKKELQLEFDRDLDTSDPIHLMATVELPEGGISTHTVSITPIPLEATWSLQGNEVTPRGTARGEYVDALHQEALGRLSIYLRDDQQAFLSQDGAYEVSLTIPGFKGTPGTYNGENAVPGWVSIDIEYREQDVRCVSARSTVELTRWESEEVFSGAFTTGSDTLCYVGDQAAQASPLSGTFLLNKP